MGGRKRGVFEKGTWIEKDSDMSPYCDRFNKFKPAITSPGNEDLIGNSSEQYWEYVKEDRMIEPHWCHGIVAAGRWNNRVCIEWDEKHLWLKNSMISDKRFMKSTWSKYVIKGKY